MIAIYGATGYTGRRIAARLVEKGHSVLLAGRARAGLEALADRLDGPVTVHTATLDDPDALATTAGRASVIVNCAGPFVRTCQPVAEAAIAGGAHYIDISAEQPGAKWCFSDGHIRARAARTALIPSSAFYSALADLLAAQAHADLGPMTEMTAAYSIDNWAPIGTSLESRFEGIGREWFEHDRGMARARTRFPRTDFFDFPAPVGHRRVTAFPISETFIIPAHVDVDRFSTRLTTSTLGPDMLGRFQPAVTNGVSALMHTKVRPLLERGIAAVWGASAEGIADSDPTRFTLTVDARGDEGSVRSSLRGRGIYDITAPIAAEIAIRASRQDFESFGALPPSRVLDLDWALTHLEDFDLEYHAGTWGQTTTRTSTQGM